MLTTVIIPRSLKKSLQRKPREMQDRIAEAVTQLRRDPRHPSLHVHRVNHSPGIFEARIDRKNRITFYWYQGSIVMENHCNHDILEGRR